MWPQWHFWFRRQLKCGSRFAWLSKHPGLATCKGATIEVVKARCHNSSCNLCLSFGPFETRSLQQGDCTRNTSELLLARLKAGPEWRLCSVEKKGEAALLMPIAYFRISASSKYGLACELPLANVRLDIPDILSKDSYLKLPNPQICPANSLLNDSPYKYDSIKLQNQDCQVHSQIGLSGTFED